jgi:RNA polymerase sigma factor (sigma-70 family)
MGLVRSVQGGLPSSRRLIGDARLARMAKRGDPRAFEAIFRRYHQELYRYCRAILADADEAHDALQGTMAAALRGLPRCERRIALRSWLYRVAHNESISIMRRRQHPVDPASIPDAPTAGAEEVAESREHLRRVIANLHALPDRQRSAIVMRELSGLGYGEIASALITSEAGARQAVYEARTALRASRADLRALAPPLSAVAATSLLGHLLGEGGAAGGAAGIGVGSGAAFGAGVASSGAGAAGGVAATVKATSIVAALAIGAGAAGVGGGLDLPLVGARERSAPAAPPTREPAGQGAGLETTTAVVASGPTTRTRGAGRPVRPAGSERSARRSESGGRTSDPPGRDPAAPEDGAAEPEPEAPGEPEGGEEDGDGGEATATSPAPTQQARFGSSISAPARYGTARAVVIARLREILGPGQTSVREPEPAEPAVEPPAAGAAPARSGRRPDISRVAPFQP